MIFIVGGAVGGVKVSAFFCHHEYLSVVLYSSGFSSSFLMGSNLCDHVYFPVR